MDLVILDAPATGHALGMLRSPQTFGAIARVGPIVRQTREVQELLADPSQTDYVAVALGTELAVTETIEFEEGLQSAVGREPAAVLVNGLVPRRFNGAEMEQIEGLLEKPGGGAKARGGLSTAVAESVRRARPARRTNWRVSSRASWPAFADAATTWSASRSSGRRSWNSTESGRWLRGSGEPPTERRRPGSRRG